MTVSAPLKNTFNVGVIKTSVPTPYTIGVSPAASLPSGDSAPHKIGFYSKYTTQLHPATGNKITGFKWDQRLWTDDESENWYQQIPKNTNPTTSGVEDYFQYGNGYGRDIELDSIIRLVSSGVDESNVYNPYSPVVYHGHYYNGVEENFLFSDSSELVYPEHDIVVSGVWANGAVEPIEQGFSIVSLNSIPKAAEPITAITMQWDKDKRKYYITREWKKMGRFTGLVENREHLDTWNDNTKSIVWNNIDTTKDEFVVTYSGVNNGTDTYPSAIFSNQVSEEVGLYEDFHIKFDELEILGISDGEPLQQFHSVYAPIDSSVEPRVLSFLYTPSGVIGGDILASGIDWNGMFGGGILPLGIIQTGYLSTDVTEWLPRAQGVTPSGYSVNIDYDLGVFQFGTEDGGVLVPSAGEIIGVAYSKTARVEYEPEDTINTVTGLRSNLNPTYRHSANGFVFISNKDLQPTNIVLTANASLIATDLYGPIYIGGTLTKIIATVTDNDGLPIDNETVTFSLNNDTLIGNFASSSTSVSAVTNVDGQAHVYYLTPRTIDDIGEVVTYDNFSIDNAPTYSGVTQTTTCRTSTLPVAENINTDLVSLFKIETNDYTLGGLDPAVDYSDFQAQEHAYYDSYLTELGIGGPTGIPITDYVSNKPWEELHRELQGMLEPSIYGFNNATGKKTIVSAWDAAALNPHTFALGAYHPVHPLEVSNVSAGVYDFIYDTSAYTIPVPSGSHTTPSGTNYGYFVVALPPPVKMSASVTNEELNKTLTSNEIGLDLRTPNHMNGDWILDEINQAHIDEISETLFGIAASGQHVPIGFRLRSESVTLSSALNGVTFLDINPEYNADIWDSVTPLRQTFTVSGIF